MTVLNVTLTVEEASGYAFSMTLSSEDTLSGPSGVYDVEYRDGENGAWQLWKDDVTETVMQFTSIPGHSVYFRVRTKDRVDNEGQSAVMGPYTVELETIKYYYFGGQRVAMRRCDAGGLCDDPLYLHGDHLGSVSLTTDSSGAVVAQARYMPYGEVRWESSPSPTDYGFTGQRLDGFGLMDFNARFYSQRLGRFISADTIIPNPGDATSFDRFAYVQNNPLRFIDPSGHGACDGPYKVPECDEIDPDSNGLVEHYIWVGMPAENPDYLQWYGNTEWAFQHGSATKEECNMGNYTGVGYQCYSQGMHSGLDFFYNVVEDYGIPVYAGTTGFVSPASCTNCKYYGPDKVVLVQTYGGMEWKIFYGHLAHMQVKAGDYVYPDTIIGYIDVGQEHLHIEIRREDSNGVYMVNPLPYFTSSLQTDLINVAQEQYKLEDNMSRITFHGSMWQTPYDQPVLRNTSGWIYKD